VNSNQELWPLLIEGFVHRFARPEHIVGLLTGIRGLINSYSSIENTLKRQINSNDENILASLNRFVGSLRHHASHDPGHLVPHPGKGSACKRLHLYLRWMVRKDDVDPGGWDLAKSLLMIPLDTHMHHLSVALNMTRRKYNDIKTVIEITKSFSKISPDDPVKYDFALTRLGIRKDLSKELFIKKCKSHCLVE
jgi:uncharacterized protein (TIGR02757 family)